MHLPKFFVLADQGEVKFMRLSHNGGRPPSFVLEDAIVLMEPHQDYRERFSDRAGSFPSQGGATSVGETHHLAEETLRRNLMRIAEQVNRWLSKKGGPSWALAAPAEINLALLKVILPEHKANLRQNLREDLIHLPSSQLMAHLEAKTTSDIA